VLGGDLFVELPHHVEFVAGSFDHHVRNFSSNT